MSPILDLVYFNAGGGHRSAALALQEVIAEQKRPWTVRLVNLTEVLDPRDRFRRLTGIGPEDLYNLRLARGWTFGFAKELRLFQAMIRLSHASLLRALQLHWAATEPDLVVSLVPNFNRVLYESVTRTLPGVAFVTVLTDMADLPPHFWIERGQDQHLVCGTPHAARQARDCGYPEQRISLTSGMILRPAFYRDSRVERDVGLRALGLDPARPTGLVLFGGRGSMQMVSIATALRRDVQLILLCGHNEALARRLRAIAPGAPAAVIGFTDDVGRYMRLADFFIGKPGPGSISEAVQMGLPVVTFENAWTMPQERFNTRWVREQEIGIVLPSIRAIRAGVDRLLADLPRLKQRVAAIENRALFEVPEIFEALLARSALPTGSPFDRTAGERDFAGRLAHPIQEDWR